MFKTFQQKDISGLLIRLLWQNDPSKANWSILAKAYSMIREHKAKDAAPLDVFLSLCLSCPYIGVIPRDDYLSVMGWEIVGEDGKKIMERRFLLSRLASSGSCRIAIRSLGVDDQVFNILGLMI